MNNVRIKFPMSEQNWNKVVVDSQEDMVIEHEGLSDFIADYASDIEAGSALSRLQGLVPYEILTGQTWISCIISNHKAQAKDFVSNLTTTMQNPALDGICYGQAIQKLLTDENVDMADLSDSFYFFAAGNKLTINRTQMLDILASDEMTASDFRTTSAFIDWYLKNK